MQTLNSSCSQLVQRTRVLLRGPRHGGCSGGGYLYDQFDSKGSMSDSSEEEEPAYVEVPVSERSDPTTAQSIYGKRDVEMKLLYCTVHRNIHENWLLASTLAIGLVSKCSGRCY